MVDLARKFDMTPAAVGYAVQRGEKIAEVSACGSILHPDCKTVDLLEEAFMGGRFGKYGDIKRKTQIRNRRPLQKDMERLRHAPRRKKAELARLEGK